MKQIKLHDLQKENLLNGGGMFLVECPDIKEFNTMIEVIENEHYRKISTISISDEACFRFAPLQVGDGFAIEGMNKSFMDLTPLKFKVKSIKCVRVQDIYGNYKADMMGRSNELGYMNEYWKEYINTILTPTTYEQNPYVFLVEV